jgi:hypothetical protein
MTPIVIKQTPLKNLKIWNISYRILKHYTESLAQFKTFIIDLLLTNRNDKSPSIVDVEIWRFIIAKGKINKETTPTPEMEVILSNRY